MKEIYDLMMTNLANVGIGILIFLLSYISNISFSIYYNIKVLGQKFNKEQAINSLLKVVAFAVGCASLVIVITALPLFANYVGLPLPDEFVNNLTMISIVGLPLYASVKYSLMSWEKMKKVIDSGTITLSEFEEDIREANLKEAEENEKRTVRIIDAIKDGQKEDSKSIIKYDPKDGEKLSDKDVNKLMNMIDEAIDLNDTNEFYPEESFSPKALNDPDNSFNKNFKDHTEIDQKEETVEKDLNSSQQIPDEVNFEQMEAEQLEG